MKTKTVGISLMLVICSVLFAWYAIGVLYDASFNGIDVRLAGPANNTITNNASVIFNCTAATNESLGIGNITLWLSKDGGEMLYNRTNATSKGDVKNISALFNQVTLPEGLWRWMCKGSNSTFGNIQNSSNTTRVVIIDTTAPVITFNATTPANNSYIKSIEGTDDVTTDNKSLTIAVVITELYPVNLTINVTMLNATGTTLALFNNTAGKATYNLTNLSLTIPFATKYYNTSDVTYEFNDATFRVEIRSSDNASNRGTAYRTITTDSKDPWMNITYPGLAQVGNASERIFKANATSITVPFFIDRTDTNIDNTSYRRGAGTGYTNYSFTTNSSITFTLNATSQNGTQLIYFITKDKAGREVVNSTWIEVDLAPVISLGYPATGLWVSTGANILFNFTAINNDTNASKLHSCALWGNLVGANASYIINKTLNSSVSNVDEANMGSYNGTTVRVNISLNLLEGNYTWAVWCNDTTRNSIYTANRTLYVDLTAPSASASAAESTGRSTIGLGDTVTLTCTAADTINGVSTHPTAAVTKVVKPDGSIITNPGTSLASIDQTGTYTIYCQADDTAGYSTISTATFTAEYGSGLGGTSNGGGGAGVVKTQTVTIPGILPGSPNFVKLADPQEYALKQIEIDVLNAVNNVKITVKKLSEKPASATSEAAETAGDVYKYIEVLKENMKDADIKKASMTFQVPKSWLEDKGATKEQVTLKRLKGTSWEKLATTIADEDDDNIYYKASAPGLSYFAVVIEEKPAVVTEEEAAEIEAEQAAEEAEELAAAEEAAPSRTGLWITLAALIVVIAGAAAAVIYFKKKR